ncbi:undecaprenyldiphospho-muramoylpentapeptide beta-N-acetylglucosaminyltransferase [Leadbettera azotonutricia]|uniref:UDP-N-acetylglucosamine--N-acetylmuramyl-(pentapeptide) pyrophosphoryl-undecaprenol N-acetylglucosamine transferase n=1 Tax=Leadbettera azotonutricia (strain ATCC BAA-888 / DSM 13862 / ZAS-9) TaxID=545695 RepID=F5YFI8_LEAAZ|nr:undecaprenyldiphospho-muramoylpentapeptide beta-N-acetylglucosaminyltransferase [Leadbettera azotonutricia]AEF82550.1 undecaprenyldiphospho-muramoylpentapeptide beta-N-acetylglucosaminyltransferase [Leadbettera azotonutricia ZAS-9]
MISVAFTGGGTGGHIYPGLAVASWLKKIMDCRVFWIGADSGMDRAIVEEAGLEFFGIPTGKLRRYFSLKNISDIFRIVRGYFAARKIFRREKPALLFSKGGFVSVPPCAAAFSLKIPVFAHESDLSPGLATRINTRFTEKLFIPYKETAAFFAPAFRAKLVVSGNPIRPEFSGADPARGRQFLGLQAERMLLVLGGSQGSQEINGLIKASLPSLTRYYTVVHQTGSQDEIFMPSDVYKPYGYIKDELPHVIAAAELVVCRGGAGTIWECAGLGKPMIIIPLRGSGTRGDQVENARIFAEAGAAISMVDDPSPQKLSDLVLELAADEQKRNAMGAAKPGKADAANYIASMIKNKVGQ